MILVKNETSPEDIEGMNISRGILTAKGGATSHAAVVARGMGTPCVCGLSALSIDLTHKTITIKETQLKETQLKEGDVISIDGSTGKVYA